MYVNIIIYSNKLLLFVWSTSNKEKKNPNKTKQKKHKKPKKRRCIIFTEENP